MASNLASKLKKILKEEFSFYLSNIASTGQDIILKNFDEEKDVDGKPFAELESYTQNERKRLGYGATSPILKRTKKLRNSIKVIPNFVAKKCTIDSVDYGEYLHDGRDNMKPRRILDFPKVLQPDGIKAENIFEKFEEKFTKRIVNALGGG